MKRFAALAAALAFAGTAFAQADFPSRQMTILVGFAPGGATDTAARIIAKKLSENLGQPVVVENKPGAGGTLGAADVARAQPDGYKVLVWHIGMSTAPALYRRLSFDTLKDFE